MVMLEVDGRQLLTKAADVSMDGLLLKGDFGVQEGGRVPVRIPLPRDRVIDTEATIVRRSPGWAALQLDELDWDDLLALARYVHPKLAS